MAGCRGSPTDPSSASSSASGFSIALPIAPGDSANAAYGIWPFGVHGSSHALDGHPGIDFEFRVGASVRAAADGKVSVMTDVFSPDKVTLQLEHVVSGGRHFQTVYTNVGQLAPGISDGVTVRQGQMLGVAGSQFITQSGTPVLFAMTHFQVQDFARNEGLTNPNAASPDEFWTPDARDQFNAIWQTAAYTQEFCEPMTTNSRLAAFPFTRTWTLTTGPLPARLIVRCVSDNPDAMEYTFQNADGSTSESGTVRLRWDLRPTAAADFLPAGGAGRQGLYDIVGGRLLLSLSASGGTRPTALAGASTFTSQ